MSDQTKLMRGSSDYIIPIYLDTNTLLDLLASIEDGFSLVEKVSTRSSTTGTAESSVGAEVGISSILNMLKISVGSSKRKKQTDEGGEERHAERYHTYGSLLCKLRSNLYEAGLLKIPTNNEDLKKLSFSDFVELQGEFRPHSFVEYLINFKRLVEMFLPLVEAQPQETNKKGKRRATKTNDPFQSQFKVIEEAIESILSELEKAGIRTFVVDLTDGSNYKVVVSLFKQYLRDGSMTEIYRREFRLLGKVVQNIHHGDKEIDLLRGTALGALNEENLNEIVKGFKEAKPLFKLPDIKTKIEPPALEVIPIAIYV